MDDSWRMVVLCALTTAFAYMHRSMLSVAMVVLSNALGWSRDQELYVLSGFYYGCAFPVARLHALTLFQHLNRHFDAILRP